jgi:nucleoside-diphosphate-sugar epimerase
MTGNRILITGATGTIGSSLLNYLIKNSSYCLAVTVREKLAQDCIFGPSIKHINYNAVTFRDEIIEFSPEIVLHLASYSSSNADEDSIRRLVDSNIVFLSRLLDALSSSELKLFINTGSFSEYSSNDNSFNPAYFYSATKTASRSIVSYYKNILKMKSCTIVPYSVYGGKSNTKKVFDFILDSLDCIEPIKMTKGLQILDFIHINDVVSFYVHLLNNIDLIENEQTYHLGTGIGTEIKKVAAIMGDISGSNCNINWGGLDYRDSDIMRSVASINMLEQDLKWSPSINLRKGIELCYYQRLSERAK